MRVRETAEWGRITEWAGTLADLGGAAGLLAWDRETTMPASGAEGRASQLGTLATFHHRELVRHDIGDDIAALIGRDDLDPDAAALLRLASRERERAGGVPEQLVRAITEACSRGVAAWAAAREADDFSLLEGPLTTIVGLKRREAEAIGVGEEPYDALLDQFEPGARARDMEPVFADLRTRLAPIVAAAAERPVVALPPREWPIAAQMALADDIADLVGFDRSRGVIARSAHPFMSSPHRGDVRFSTRATTDSPLDCISSVLHELGHALYEQGFPGEVARTPLYDAPSLGAHESQSRFWENRIGHTLAFWEAIEPALRRHFPDAMVGIDPSTLHAAALVVRPSLIRVEADEVTYNLHIVVRFELELAMIRGDLEVADLPGAFADGLEGLLGVRPGSDAVGAMQDIHWPDGLFGYFPTYTLGNLYSAQLADAAEGELGDLGSAVSDGRCSDILAFMRDRVHRHGARMPTGELMAAATGVPLDSDALISYLRRSYAPD